MKSLITSAIVAFSLALSPLVVSGASAGEAAITAGGPAKLDKKGTLELSGSGFAPNSEIVLVFATDDGVQSDIGYALKPAPAADAGGNWKTTWSYGRFVKKKLVKAGDYTLVATDADFNPVAKAKIQFVK